MSGRIKTTLLFEGHIPSKKNNRIGFSKGISLPSRAYREWHHQQISSLPPIRLYPPYEITISCQPGTWINQDLSNIEASILDLLVTAGILEDDNRWALPKTILLNLPYVKGQTRTTVEILSSPTPDTWKNIKQRLKNQHS